MPLLTHLLMAYIYKTRDVGIIQPPFPLLQSKTSPLSPKSQHHLAGKRAVLYRELYHTPFHSKKSPNLNGLSQKKGKGKEKEGRKRRQTLVHSLLPWPHS